MSRKSQHLQIRVSPDQKATLKRRAARAGEDVSSYVLKRALPDEESRFEDLLVALRHDADRRFALAELNDLLAGLSASRLREVVASADVEQVPDPVRNYVAAMVEQATQRKGVDPPDWTRRVAPLEEPFFATPLPGLRLHLLKRTPVAFKRRNIFIDSSVGDRV
jgi:uncharacterized protein (DUF1778 family)